MLTFLNGRLAPYIMGGLLALSVIIWASGAFTAHRLQGQIHKLEGQVAQAKTDLGTCRANYADAEAAMAAQKAATAAAKAEALSQAQRATKAATQAQKARSKVAAVAASIPPAKPGPNTSALCQAADDMMVKFGKDL